MQPTTTDRAANPLPRKKRRWKILGAAALVLIGVPVAYWFITGWQADRELEAIIAEIDADDPNWRWPDLIAELEPPPDDKNSAAQVIKVHKLLTIRAFRLPTKFETDKALETYNARLSAENTAILRQALAALDPQCLKEARKLKDMPDGRFKIEPVENPFRLTVDKIQNVREVLYLLSHDATLRGQDDPDGAAESCVALIHTAHAINDHPTLLSQLVRMAGQAISVAAVERLLGQGVVSEKKLALLQAALEREADANTLLIAVRGERAMGHQLFTSMRSRKTPLSQVFGGGKKGGPGFSERVLDLFPGLILRGEADHLRLLHDNIKASKLPEGQREAAFGEVERKARDSRSWLVRQLLPAVTKVHEASKRTRAMMRCAYCGVAAERYRLKHGDWPKGLQDLVRDGLIKEVPIDPYDGQPLRLRATPTGLIIYSVGVDKTDNGGKRNRENMMETGTDLGFELWNAPEWRGVAPPAVAEVP